MKVLSLILEWKFQFLLLGWNNVGVEHAAESNEIGCFTVGQLRPNFDPNFVPNFVPNFHKVGGHV